MLLPCQVGLVDQKWSGMVLMMYDSLCLNAVKKHDYAVYAQVRV